MLITCVDEIVSKFVYFPELHRMLSSRPNVTPIVITTGVGPAGRKTVHYQDPSEDENEPRVFSATQLQQIRTLQEVLDAARAPSPASQSPFDSFPSSLDFDESERKNLKIESIVRFTSEICISINPRLRK